MLASGLARADVEAISCLAEARDHRLHGTPRCCSRSNAPIMVVDSRTWLGFAACGRHQDVVQAA
jgi:hypothetical protein